MPGELGLKVLEDSGVLVIVATGRRDVRAGEEGLAKFLDFYKDCEADRILYDLRPTVCATEPGVLMDRAIRAVSVLRPSRVAILATDLESTIARIYRKAIADAGHDCAIFTSVAEAQVWLDWSMESEALPLV
ncbi:MAG: hypothetical protein ABL308_00595 [Oceanicaulis sp.]